MIGECARSIVAIGFGKTVVGGILSGVERSWKFVKKIIQAIGKCITPVRGVRTLKDSAVISVGRWSYRIVRRSESDFRVEPRYVSRYFVDVLVSQL